MSSEISRTASPGSSLEALVRVARSMAGQTDPVEALWTLIGAIQEDLSIDRAGIFEFQRERQLACRIVGVNAAGRAEYEAPPIDVTQRTGPLSEVALGLIPYYLSDDAPRDYPNGRFTPGVRAMAVVPIRTGGELLGLLAVDTCRTGRPIPETSLQHLFLYAGLSAQSLFAIYQKKERERTEAMRKSIYREVFQAATNGKIRLCTEEEIADEWPAPAPALSIEREQDIAAVREAARNAALECGIDPERAWDLALCSSEGATNALVHGQGGSAAAAWEDGSVRVRIADRGKGIPLEELPDATLRPGWSRGRMPSMGHGFVLMYKLADHVYLSTGSSGTTIIIEMCKEPVTLLPSGWEDLL
jgi:anti-sigma regulatory factor (Ser/Thr protein kinase)